MIAGPRLRSGNDKDAADRLRELVFEANYGVRRIIAAGLYVEKIAMELPHGQLSRWLEAHCPDVTMRSVSGWRELARGILRAIEVKPETCFQFEVPLELALLNPSMDVPEAVKDTAKKIEGLISNKSARELKFQLRASEPMDGGDKVWRKWIRVNHPELIIDGKIPSRMEVSADVRASFKAATTKAKAPIDPGADAKLATTLVQHLAEQISSATSIRILGQCSEEALDDLRDAVGGIRMFIERLDQGRAAARARPRLPKRRR